MCRYFLAPTFNFRRINFGATILSIFMFKRVKNILFQKAKASNFVTAIENIEGLIFSLYLIEVDDKTKGKIENTRKTYVSTPQQQQLQRQQKFK